MISQTSEASYVYILSGQKFIKNGEMVNLASFWKSEAYGQTVLPDKSLLIGHKLVESAEMENLSCDILVIFKHCAMSLWKWHNVLGLISNNYNLHKKKSMLFSQSNLY